MENASKALLIAGGVLLAILIISVLLILNSSITNFENAQNKEKEKKEIATFNREYEAYNKSVLYGIDVITVVNKAINHNNTMSVSENDKPYYINIAINTSKDFITTGIKIDNTKTSDHLEHQQDMTKNEIKTISGNDNYGTDIESYGLAANIKDYELGEWDKQGVLQMNKGVISFFRQDVKDITKEVKGNGVNMTYYIYSGLTNFKRAVFKCTDVKYSNATGRVNYMRFEYINN